MKCASSLLWNTFIFYIKTSTFALLPLIPLSLSLSTCSYAKYSTGTVSGLQLFWDIYLADQLNGSTWRWVGQINWFIQGVLLRRPLSLPLQLTLLPFALASTLVRCCFSHFAHTHVRTHFDTPDNVAVVAEMFFEAIWPLHPSVYVAVVAPLWG